MVNNTGIENISLERECEMIEFMMLRKKKRDYNNTKTRLL